MNQHTPSKNPIPRGDILDLGDYERRRDLIRAAAIAARSFRRIELGPDATLAFENRETLTYQIHEILRAERIAKEPEVEHEIETYSELMPTASELSATLMFEFPDPDGRPARLKNLAGFERHLYLDFGPAGRAAASFDSRQIDPDQISAVQFVRFPLTEAQRERLVRSAGVRIVADHPSYTFHVDLTDATCHALAGDLEEAGSLEITHV